MGTRGCRRCLGCPRSVFEGFESLPLELELVVELERVNLGVSYWMGLECRWRDSGFEFV